MGMLRELFAIKQPLTRLLYGSFGSSPSMRPSGRIMRLITRCICRRSRRPLFRSAVRSIDQDDGLFPSLYRLMQRSDFVVAHANTEHLGRHNNRVKGRVAQPYQTSVAIARSEEHTSELQSRPH